MLALTRRVGQSVVIGSSKVTITDVLDNRSITLRAEGPKYDETVSVRPGHLAFKIEGVHVYFKGALRGGFCLLFDGSREIPIMRTELLTKRKKHGQTGREQAQIHS